MKKLLISFLLLQFLSGSAIAEDILSIPYKNIKEKAKLTYQDGIWSTKVSRKNPEYFIKFISVGTGNYSEFYKSSGAFAFTSGCQYEFIHDGKLIGYSNHDLKFYEIISENGDFINREMAPEEIQELFPDFKIIKITDFSPNTNSLKIKKESRNFKVIILNDTDKNFYHYTFTSGNAKFKRYQLAGFVNITKKGMIQFSHFGENTATSPWFVLLIR